MHLEPLSFSPRTDPISKKLLQPLPDAQSYTTLILNALLEKLQSWDGPSYHQLVGKWVEGGLSSAEDLRAWLRDIFSRGTVRQAQFDRATAQAEARHRHGIWVAVARVETVPMNSEHKCPQVLFGFGNPCWDRHWLSVFNSRKPKLVLPHDEWLSVLRSALPRIASEGLGFAGSLGTLTYDLASIYAHSIGSPHLLILSAAMEDILDAKVSPLLREGLSANLTLSCRTKAVSCPKSVCSTCRDRLLACFADFHLILEIRSKGNLLATMLRQQRAAPRFQKVYLSKNRNTNNQGNFELLQGFPDWTRAFSRDDLADGVSQRLSARSAVVTSLSMSSWQPKLWKRFLYHYTRACPGPWPDQHYRDYLLRLLTGDPLSGHTALDTLIHIILEGRLRASSKLIRGSHQTLSLTSLPPPELEKIRQWNPALIRWTFEPYGMALSREILKSLGARPTIYAGERAYQRIKSRDRFRFQRHEPPGCSWKHEREWRLPKDFDLDQVAPEEGFLFVDTRADAEAIAINTQSPMPIVILSELGKRPV